MPEPHAITNWVLIITTVLVSWRAFRDPGLLEKLIFEPRAILAYKEYHRLLTSALVHANGNHLIGNMLTLYFFGSSIEQGYSPAVLLFIYLVSILGGSALSLWLHRNHEYRALGASGGTCGVLFAAILFFPGMSVYLFFVPIPIPGWLFAIGYLAYSFVGMRKGWGNIGHDAHIGGALMGLLTAALLDPRAVERSPGLFTTILVLGIVAFVYLWKSPLLLPSRRQRFDAEPMPPKIDRRKQTVSEEEVNAVLEKVGRTGVQSLTDRERQILIEAASK
jgi:membrane associated rhomboid family serine protease